MLLLGLGIGGLVIGLLLRAEGRGSDAEALGMQVAEQLLAQGAEAILKAVYGEAAAE